MYFTGNQWVQIKTAWSEKSVRQFFLPPVSSWYWTILSKIKIDAKALNYKGFAKQKIDKCRKWKYPGEIKPARLPRLVEQVRHSELVGGNSCPSHECDGKGYRSDRQNCLFVAIFFAPDRKIGTGCLPKGNGQKDDKKSVRTKLIFKELIFFRTE
jgi:hypothetical protein